jgi:hypothetical protein
MPALSIYTGLLITITVEASGVFFYALCKNLIIYEGGKVKAIGFYGRQYNLWNLI